MIDFQYATPEAARRVLSLKEEDICKSLFVELFSNNIKKNAAGKVYGVDPPFCAPDELIIVEPGTLPNIDKKITTTIGRFIFNLYCISSIFGKSIPYINKSLNKNAIENIFQSIVDLLMEGKANTDQFAKCQNRLVWFDNFGELFIPGFSLRLITPIPEVQKRKAELLEKYKDELLGSNYVVTVAKIEAELLALAEEKLGDTKSLNIYKMGGKPSFGNNYKNTQIMVGPLMDPIKGKYEISTNSLSEGIPKDQYNVYANKTITSSYNRGVSTQDGGAKTKTLFAAMQSEVLDEPGSDCKTTLYKTVIIPKKYRPLLYRYIVEDDGNLTLLTLENINDYVGKTVQMRSPMYCKSHHICNKCAGELFYKIGIKNIGLTVTKITSTLLNLSLKSMHDITVKPTEFDPFKYMTIVKEKEGMVTPGSSRVSESIGFDKNDKESIHVFNMKETDIMLGKTPAKSYEWTDKEGKPVARFHTFDWWDGKYIEDLKVSDQYKGRGYSYQLLDYATKELGVRNLAVDKTNTIAKHVYDKYGFKIVDQDDTRLYMKLEKKVVT